MIGPRVLAEHDRWLRTVVYARLGEPQAVDEVMQEVSLAAVRQKAPLNDRKKVAAWLYRLAVTQSLLHRRKLGRQRKLVDRYVQRNQPGEQDTPECRSVKLAALGGATAKGAHGRQATCPAATRKFYF